MIRLTDKELVEGFLGSLGWVMFFFYLRNRVEWPTPIEGFLAWTLLWWLRKIGMHIYKGYKEENNIKDKFYKLI